MLLKRLNVSIQYFKHSKGKIFLLLLTVSIICLGTIILGICLLCSSLMCEGAAFAEYILIKLLEM